MSVKEAKPETERPIPYSQEAEEGVIGACLLKASAADLAVSTLKSEEFFSPHAAEVFRAIQRVYHDGRPVDLVTISHELYARGSLARIGGPDYLAGAMHNVPTAGSCGYYAKIVSSTFVLRGIEQAGQRITALASSPKDLDDVCAEVQGVAMEATERRSGTGPKAPVEFLEESDDEVTALSSKPVPGAPTGLRDLDLLLGGLRPAKLVTLAGETGLGKSSLGLATAIEAADVGYPVLIFSLEMTAGELGNRMVAYVASVPLEGYLRSGLDLEQTQRAEEAKETIRQLPILIEDTSDRTTLDIVAASRRQRSSATGLGLVIVDHLGLVTSTVRNGNPAQETSEVTRSLKRLSRQLEVPVLALCQFSRQRDRLNGRPNKQDLKWSSSIEQDSDIVILIWQPDPEVEDHRVLIVDKHRGGRKADVHVRWNGPQVRFENGGAW